MTINLDEMLTSILSMTREDFIALYQRATSQEALEARYEQLKLTAIHNYNAVADFIQLLSKNQRVQLWSGIVEQKTRKLYSLFKDLSHQRNFVMGFLSSYALKIALTLSHSEGTLNSLLKRFKTGLIEDLSSEDFFRSTLLSQDSPCGSLLILLNAGYRLHRQEAINQKAICVASANKDTVVLYTELCQSYRCKYDSAKLAKKTNEAKYFLTAYYTARLRLAIYNKDDLLLKSVIMEANVDNIALPLDDALYRAVCIWVYEKNSVLGDSNWSKAPTKQAMWPVIELLLNAHANPDQIYRNSSYIVQKDKARKALLEKGKKALPPEETTEEESERTAEETIDAVGHHVVEMFSPVAEQVKTTYTQVRHQLRSEETQQSLEEVRQKAQLLATKAKDASSLVTERAKEEAPRLGSLLFNWARGAYQQLASDPRAQQLHSELMTNRDEPPPPSPTA